MCRFFKTVAAIAVTSAICLTSAQAATHRLSFQGERGGPGMDHLGLPEFSQFVSGEIVYDDSVPVTTDLSVPLGPVHRQFGALQSFDISFANTLGFKIGEISAGPGLVDGQAAIQDFDSFDGVYFETDAFDIAFVVNTFLWLNLPDVTGPGIDQLTQDVITSSLLPGSVLTFETSSEIGPLVDIFDISSVRLETIDDPTPPAVPLPAGLSMGLTSLSVLGWIGRRNRRWES